MAKILIIDDSKTMRFQLRKVLQDAGYTVVEGADGHEGLARLKEHNDIQLIICDVNMPELDGISMLMRAKEENLTNDKMKIFMLTTEASPDLKAKAKAAGATMWMTKAFNAEKLLAVVAQVLKP